MALIARLVAPAKLTLSLRMTGLREDGYHLIDAEMVSLSLADEIELSEGSGVEVIDESSGDGLPIPLAGDNSVSRALALCGRQAHVVIRKRIPAGAGLGGGSADAAAVLRWAGIRDTRRAASIGADVAFCVIGGRARVGGVGDIVESLPYSKRSYTLLTPPFGCATPAVYRKWDDLGGPQGDYGNDLEAAALALEPRLARYRDELAAATGVRPRLAGSGSTWFVEGAFPGPGQVVVTAVEAS